MDTRTIAVVAAMMAVAGAAQAREKNPVPTEAVTVCMGTPVAGTGPAQLVASEIFARIGVRIDWRGMNHCPAEAIQISFQTMTDPHQPPGALAYALPYERVHIRVFYDRVRALGGDGETSLLGHVLAHEIGHILQGSARHSESGVMKPQFTPDDRFRMYHNRPLDFTSLDADLIHSGIEGRVRQIGRVSQTSESGKIVRRLPASGL
jgi:hypothetical protein